MVSETYSRTKGVVGVKIYIFRYEDFNDKYDVDGSYFMISLVHYDDKATAKLKAIEYFEKEKWIINRDNNFELAYMIDDAYVQHLPKGLIGIKELWWRGWV